LCHLNRELDRDTNYKTETKFYWKKRKEIVRKKKEKYCWKSSGPLPDGKEALISTTLLKVNKEAPQGKW
jgi:hypothetical protein